MMQTQTQVPPALQVLMSMGAQPTAPGPMGQPIPTIASQKVEQQAQGLEALMPGVRQQAMQSAQAAQPVTQAQLQQVMQQQSPGISGLPAQNMRFAEGGVIGYAGPDGSYVDDPETIALDELRVEEARRRREAIERKQRASFLEAAGAPQASQYVVPEVAAPRATPSVPLPPPEAQAMMRQQGPRTGIAAPRVEAPVRTASVRTAAPVAETGIATALPATPTLDKSGIATAGDAIAKAAAEREARMRGILAERERTASGMADLNAEGIAALQEANRARQELLAKQRGDDKFNRQMALLRGFQGDRAAYDRAVAGQQARDEAANQAQLMHQQAVLKLREAQQAKQLGQFDRALAFEQQAAELEGKARTSSLEAQRIAASLATSEYSGLVNLRGQDITARTAAEDRASLERRAAADRAAQAALRNLPGPEQQMMERAIKSLMDANPGMPYHEAYDKVRGAGRPERGVMTYDQASDNVQKLLDSPSGMMEVTNIRKQAKAAGQPEPSLIEVKEMLIRREMQGAGAARSGAAAPAGGAAPAVGTIMQGYRFKGGNPADKNNWEKV
jgi:hypothetical protein